MTYKVVIVDLDDTVLDFKAGEVKGLATVFKAFQTAAVDYEAWVTAYSKINYRIWREIEAGAATQPLLNDRFSKTFAQFDQVIDGEKAEAAYRQVLDANDAVVAGADTLLSKLNQAGYQLVVGTNGKTATQYSRLALTGFDRYFKQVVISQEIGHAKPSTGFFDHIFNLYPDNTKSDFLMIGDTLASDIQGANQAGIDSIWIDNSKQLGRVESHQATYRVQSLSEILQILT